MNFIGIIVSALLALAAAANVGSPQLPPGGTSAGATGWPLPTPSPTPSPAPPTPYDVIGAGGPT